LEIGAWHQFFAPFRWFELGPLTVVAVIAIAWHRRVEARLAAGE